MDASCKEQRVAIRKEYHPGRFNWRNVVFTDETPAKIRDQRGLLHAWAKQDETIHPDVKRAQVKRQSGGMVWACFEYSRKRPINFWYAEEEEKKTLQNLHYRRKMKCVRQLRFWSACRAWKVKINGKLVKIGRKPKETKINMRNARERGGIDG
jgi:hypothetical protein